MQSKRKMDSSIWKPNDKLNYNFIKKNKIEIHDFIPAENKISKNLK